MMTPEKIRGIPKRLRDVEQYVDACDDAADAIEELLTALDERDVQLVVRTKVHEHDKAEYARAREVVEAARECHCKWQVHEAIKRYDEGEKK